MKTMTALALRSGRLERAQPRRSDGCPADRTALRRVGWLRIRSRPQMVLWRTLVPITPQQPPATVHSGETETRRTRCISATPGLHPFASKMT